MALPNHRVRVFPDVVSLQSFIQTDAGIVTIVSIGTDDNGSFVLVYTVA